MKSSAKKIELASVDDLFSTEESRADAQREKVVEIPLSELHPFKGHPFKVKDDEAMMETADSIKQYGVLVPAIARPDPEGGYELVAGHRRHRASELAEKETMPVIVRDLDDDAATIIMVDSNLQRESLLPSERAFAYKMKLDIIAELGDKRMGEVSLDDIQLALVPVSKKSASVYKSVVILYKSIFRAAMESRIIDHNPTIYLTTKGGGVPQEERQALTDEQVERLLDAIRDLPPYVFVMIGLYAGLRREEILALQWDSVYLDTDTPYLTVRRAWHTEHNRPVISDELKTKAAERNIPLPVCLAECLKAAKETSTSEYVVSNRDGEPLSYTQFKRLWQYIVTRTVKERSYYRYEDGKRVKHTVTPVLGEKAAHNGKVVYSLDFEVTPHQLRHTYITNLIHASVDPKTVQYLAGHESSKITMDIYAKVKYNRPDELVRSMNCAFASWDAAQ